MEWPGDFPDDHTFVELLVPGASSDLDYEQLLKDTEEKLNLNASSIEQHLKELQTKMGDSRTADRPPSPTECLQWFNLRAQNRLAATGHQELLDFFKALQQYLKSDEQGKEEAALQLLLCLSSQCGVCFPCTPTSSSSSCPYSQLTDFSIHMVHTVKDNNSLEIQELWNAVRLHLRRYLMDQLLCRSPEFCECRKTSSLTIFERVHCLQQLFFLYPECEVLRCYQGLKRQHVLSVLHSSLNSSPGGETGFDRLAAGFCSAVPHLSQAITEELQVLIKVTQPNAILGFLNVTYLSTLAQELASQMEKEREIAQRDNSALSSKIKKYSTRSRASVVLLFPRCKKTLCRGAARKQNGLALSLFTPVT